MEEKINAPEVLRARNEIARLIANPQAEERKHRATLIQDILLQVLLELGPLNAMALLAAIMEINADLSITLGAFLKGIELQDTTAMQRLLDRCPSISKQGPEALRQASRHFKELIEANAPSSQQALEEFLTDLDKQPS